MYSGFITPTKTIKRAGIHQRFDMAAYQMIKSYLPSTFPPLSDIIHFEGYNGPDGLKVKSRKDSGPSHMYDPNRHDESAVPRLIHNHYKGLVEALVDGDHIRAAFDASWMAHYLGDALTPAHHWPFDEEVHAAREIVATVPVNAGEITKLMAQAKKTWALWGFGGTYSSHFNFENGIAIALIVVPIRPRFDESTLVHARKLGIDAFVHEQALQVAELDIYTKFMETGWTNEIVNLIKSSLAPRVAATIGYVWMLAVLEAGQQFASSVETPKTS